MNTSNTSNTFVLTSYETHATDRFGNTYIAVDSNLDCSGCALSGHINLVPCISVSAYCTAPTRINNHHVIWQRVENLPIINMPINTLRHLFIESLISIRNGTKRDNYLKICSNLYNNLAYEFNFCSYNSLLCILSTRFVKKFCQSWEHYSDDLNFPIPNDSIGKNYLLWHGVNLTYRISLIDHLIEKIKSNEFEKLVIDIIKYY